MRFSTAFRTAMAPQELFADEEMASKREDMMMPARHIDELKSTAPKEYKFGSLACLVMSGIQTKKGWLVLRKNNQQTSNDDNSKYEVDFVFTLDGKEVGALDVEQKMDWFAGGCPWPYLNIAKYPMSHWQRGRFNGRPTNKWLCFEAVPLLSFFVAIRRDYGCCRAIHWPTAKLHGYEYLQKTKYSNEPLPVLRVPIAFTHEISTPEQFKEMVLYYHEH